MQNEYSFKPRRALGRTGFVATALGIGDLADRAVPLGQCVATVQRALDAGLNLIDTAPAYEDGYSEEIVGKALKGRRDEIFVIDKIDNVEEPVAPQIEESLLRLGLDHTDLFLFHGVSELAVWQRIVRPGGGMDELAQCVRAGKCRFRGVSSHHPDVLRAAIESGTCDVVMFAVGPFCDRRFVEEILPLAKSRCVGTVCFKTFGAGKLVADTAGYGKPLVGATIARSAPEQSKIQLVRRSSEDEGGNRKSKMILPHLSVEECVHYTLTCDPDVALLGLSFPNEQDAAFEAASKFKPLSAEQMADIRRRAEIAVRDKGACWWNPK